VRDNIRGSLPGADASIPNSVLRVLSDAQGGLCHLVLQYLDWLALQLMPDTAETEWLDRHGEIWLVNADGTIGRKMATFASGSATFVGIPGGVIVPQYTQLSSLGVGFQTTAQIVVDDSGGDAPVQALDPGSAGNLAPGTLMELSSTVPNIDPAVTVVSLTGGTDTETDDELRARILQRIRNPPMGGDLDDYVAWALAVPGVTRAWAASEMGIGTISVRFLMDDLRAADDGWPLADDVKAVSDYVNLKRPVTVEDCFVMAPTKQFIDITIGNLVPANSPATQAAIEASVQDMLFAKAAPGQTIYAAWISYAIMSAPGVVSFNLITEADYVMPSQGHMAVLETILYQ
jgi:uncharacterized phage protein gp47/JayE